MKTKFSLIGGFVVFVLFFLAVERCRSQTLVLEFADAPFRTNTFWRTPSGTWTSQVLAVKSAYWVIGGVSTNPVSGSGVTTNAMFVRNSGDLSLDERLRLIESYLYHRSGEGLTNAAALRFPARPWDEASTNYGPTLFLRNSGVGMMATNPVVSPRFELTPVWHQPVMADVILSWEPVLGATSYNVYAQSVKTSNAWVQVGRAIADLRHSFPFDLSVPVYTHVRAVSTSSSEGRPSAPMKHDAIVPLPAPSVRPAGILPHSQKRRSTATPEPAPSLPPLGSVGQTVPGDTAGLIQAWLDARPTNTVDFRDIPPP